MKILLLLLSKIFSEPLKILPVLEILFQRIPPTSLNLQSLCLYLISIVTKYDQFRQNLINQTNIRTRDRQSQDGAGPSRERSRSPIGDNNRDVQVIFVDSQEEDLFQANNRPIAPPNRLFHSSTPINESSAMRDIFELISQNPMRIEECLEVFQNQEEESRHYFIHNFGQKYYMFGFNSM